MAENIDNENEPAFDPRFQTESLAFDTDKLVACAGCSRTNPPNRLKCLYCGHELEIDLDDAASVKTNLRKLELWERGINLILCERDPDVKADTEKLSALFSMDPDDLSMIIDAGTPLPIARVESEKEADLLLAGSEQFGLKCILVRDDALAASKPPVRLTGMEITDGHLALKHFNTGNLTESVITDLILIVPGSITENRVDSVEKRGLRKRTQLVDETATSMDEAILDIYLRNDPTGFRVRLAGFDFSCLGQKKGLLAGENLLRLTDLLKNRAAESKYVDNYIIVRQPLGLVWDVEFRKDAKGKQPTGFGKTEFATIASTSNLNQFTKYSRLQWHLL